jgi:hypothetical protein
MPHKRFLPKTRFINMGEMLSGWLNIIVVTRILAGSGDAVPSASTASKAVTKESEAAGKKDMEQGTGGRDPNPGPEKESSDSSKMRPGWHTPHPETLPRPTYWPVVMALGITFMAFGVVTTLIISGVGFILFALALARWIGDILHE